MKKKLLLKLMKFSLYGLMLQTMFVGILLASDVNAQRKQLSVKKVYVTVHLNDASLGEVFRAIEASTDFVFNYDDHIIARNKSKISMIGRKSVADVLIQVSESAGVKFKQVNNNINVEEIKGRRDKAENLEIVLQSQSVSGRVVSQEDNEPLVGVSIIVKGTSKGTITDINGDYTLDVPSSESVLVFSFVGYEPQEIQVGTQNVINLSMKPDIATLGEIVVVGYGVQKRSSVTGAVSSVSAKEISALPVPSVSAALQGRVPGVLVTNNGSPGSNAIVRIRGIGSITQNADPLYVVDGFPTPNFNLNSVDTKDIESVEILKDAAATAVYGSRAANGVVIITTKNGSKSRGVQVNIEAYAGTQSAWKQLDLLNREAYLDYGTELLTNAGSPAPARFSAMNEPIYPGATQTFAETETDWQEEMFRAAPISQIQGSVSGSNEKTTMFMSFGRFQQDGIMLGTSFERYNGRLNSETKISKRFTIGETLQVSQSTNHNQLESGGRTMIMHMLRSVPYIAVRNPTVVGGFNGTTTADGSDPENPVRLALMDKRLNRNLNILGQAYLEASIIEGLKYKFTYGVNYSASRNTTDDPIFSDGGYQGRTTHDLGDTRNNYFSPYYSNQLTYDKTIGNHNINFVAVAERQDEKTTNLAVTGRQSTNDLSQLTGSSNPVITDGSLTETVLLSFLGRVNYDYNGKYLLSASMRRDGFSGFAPGHKWGNFPGASVGWKLSEESFMQGISKISELKIRASYGKVGAKPQAAYGYNSFISSNTLYPFNNVTTQGTFFDKLPNPEFAWEISTMKNVGLDLALFDNQFTFSGEYFVKNTDHLILGTPPAESLGFNQSTDRNVGGMKNWGYEFTAGYSKVGNKFTFNVTGNVSVIKNEVTKLYTEKAAFFSGGNQDYGGGNITRTIAGYSIQHFFLDQVDGIFQSVDEIINSEGRPTQEGLNLPLLPDGTVDMSSTSDAGYNNPANMDKYTRPGDIRFKSGGPKDLGSFLPKFSYGLNLSATYNGFDLTMFIQGVNGNKIYNGTKVITEGMLRLFNAGTAVSDAWTPTNTDTNVPRAVNGDPNGNARPSDRFLEDGSYLRIKDLSIGYTLPTSFLSFTNGTIKKFRIYVSSQNLLTVTNYSGYDPEVGNRYNNDPATNNNRFLTNGVDYGQFPQARTFLGGIQLGF